MFKIAVLVHQTPLVTGTFATLDDAMRGMRGLMEMYQLPDELINERIASFPAVYIEPGFFVFKLGNNRLKFILYEVSERYKPSLDVAMMGTLN